MDASRKRSSLLSLGLVSALLSLPSRAEAQDCFERLDNGIDKTGWRASTTNHHGPGDNWVVEDGALVGRQSGNQLGGILMTERSYSDVEVTFEVQIDWGCDSGFFLRTTAGDRAYQACIDHLDGSSVGSIYGEQVAGGLLVMPYTLTNGGNTAVVAPGQKPLFDVAQWSTLWHPTEFNEMRVRIEGNPPHIQIWIRGTQVADYTDTMVRSDLDPSGPLSIQVHGGGRWVPGGAVRFRNIRARDLTVDCVPTTPTTGGAGGTSPGGAAGNGGVSPAGGVSTVEGGSAGGSSTSGAPTVMAGEGGSSSNSGDSTMPTTSGASSLPNQPAATQSAGSSTESGCNAGAKGSTSKGWPSVLLLLAAALLTRRYSKVRTPTAA